MSINTGPLSKDIMASLEPISGQVSVQSPEDPSLGPPPVTPEPDPLADASEDSVFTGEEMQVAAGGGRAGPLGLLRRQARAARRAIDPSGARTTAELFPEETLDEIYDAVTDPSGPRSAFTRGAAGINLDRVQTAEDAKAVIDRVGEIYGNRARTLGRDVVSNEETSALANQLAADLGDDGLAKMILEREKAGTFNAHQMLAARDFYTRTVEDLVQFATKVMDDPSPQSIAQFRHRLALSTAIYAQVKGAQMEAARTLQASRIPSYGGPPPGTRAGSGLDAPPAGAQPPPGTQPGTGHNGDMGAYSQQEMQDLLQREGGVAAAQTAARAVLDAHAEGNLGLTSRVARRVQGKDVVDAVIEGWLGGLVSSPDTWLLSLAGNATVAGMRNFEHWSMAAVRTIGNRDLAEMMDPFLFTAGQLAGAVNGLALAARTLRHGEVGLASKFTDGTMGPAISAKTFREQRLPFVNDKTLGGAYQGLAEKAGRLPGGQLLEPALLYSSGVAGRITDFAGEYYFRLPFRVLSAEDQLFRSISYTGELTVGAMRYARENAASSGRPVIELFEEAMADPEQFIPGVHMKSLAQAREDVLQNPGHDTIFGFLQTAANRPIGRLFIKPIFPFMRVINNSLQWSWDRLPLLPQVVDAMRTPGPDNRWNRLIGNAGVSPARDEEIAKIVTGTTLLGLGWFAAQAGNFNGNVGGEGTGAEAWKIREGARLLGLQGNSVVFRMEDGSDKQYDLNRIDPAAMMFLISAMTNEALAVSESDEERNSAVLMGALAMRDVLADKSALGTLDETLKVWGAGSGSFDDRLNTFIATRVSSLVPSYLAKIRRVEDEGGAISQGYASNPYDSQWLRLLSEIHNRVTNRLPSRVAGALGLDPHETLPDHVNMFGEEWRRPAGWPMEWGSFVATNQPLFSREQLNAVLPEHLHNILDLRRIRDRDLTKDELRNAIKLWGPHGELDRLRMPVGKRRRQWHGVKLSGAEHVWMTQYEGPTLLHDLEQLMASQIYIDAPDVDDLKGSKQDLIRAVVRRDRERIDAELMVHPTWQKIADAARLRERMAIEGRVPLGEEVPGLEPGDAGTPEDVLRRVLGGSTE